MAKETMMRFLRIEQNIPQKYMANVCGITEATYSMYENGLRSIPEKYANKIAKELKVNKNVILESNSYKPKFIYPEGKKKKKIKFTKNKNTSN